MTNEMVKTNGAQASPFERIRRTNEAGIEFWSSRNFSEILGYGDYRNFEGVIEKAKLSCFNSGHRIEDHFVDVTEMIEIGKGGQRPVKTVLALLWFLLFYCHFDRREKSHAQRTSLLRILVDEQER